MYVVQKGCNFVSLPRYTSDMLVVCVQFSPTPICNKNPTVTEVCLIYFSLRCRSVSHLCPLHNIIQTLHMYLGYHGAMKLPAALSHLTPVTDFCSHDFPLLFGSKHQISEKDAPQPCHGIKKVFKEYYEENWRRSKQICMQEILNKKYIGLISILQQENN